MPRPVGDRVTDPRHAGALEGAHAVGEASGGERLVVRIGLWHENGRVIRARFRASTCASLIAYADAACEAVEAGEPPARLDPARVRGLVAGVHPVHHDRAVLVSAALHDAGAIGGPPPSAEGAHT